MPLWRIYHPDSVYQTPSEKQAFAASITSMYTSIGLPAFYVNVLFIPVSPSSFYIGGVSRPSAGPDSSIPFIRITIQHIARSHGDKEQVNKMLNRIDEVIAPWVGDKGFASEYSIEEHSRELWKVDGLVPPMQGSEAERRWARENRSSAFGKEEGGLV